jgi:hypothetical protein
MSPTVHELRNLIRGEVGRFEREVDAQFTKEELAAIANEVGYVVDDGPSPSKSRMRSGIRWRVELSETEAAAGDGSFRKDELEAIASHLDIEATRGE